MSESLGSVVEELATEFSRRTMNRLITSKSENYSSCHEVLLNTSLLVLQEFGCKYVCHWSDSSANMLGQRAVRDAYSVLME